MRRHVYRGGTAVSSGRAGRVCLFSSARIQDNLVCRSADLRHFSCPSTGILFWDFLNEILARENARSTSFGYHSGGISFSRATFFAFHLGETSLFSGLHTNCVSRTEVCWWSPLQLLLIDKREISPRAERALWRNPGNHPCCFVDFWLHAYADDLVSNSLFPDWLGFRKEKKNEMWLRRSIRFLRFVRLDFFHSPEEVRFRFTLSSMVNLRPNFMVRPI